jgi:hypothetical protein
MTVLNQAHNLIIKPHPVIKPQLYNSLITFAYQTLTDSLFQHIRQLHNKDSGVGLCNMLGLGILLSYPSSLNDQSDMF